MVGIQSVLQIGMGTLKLRIELANKIVNGRAVGSLYGVAIVKNGRRCGWALKPQESRAKADEFMICFGA